MPPSFFNKYLFLVHDFPINYGFSIYVSFFFFFNFYLPWRPTSIGLWYFKICLKNNFTCFIYLLNFFFMKIEIIVINYILKIHLASYFYTEVKKRPPFENLFFFKKIRPQSTLFWSNIFCFFSFVSFGCLHWDYFY